MTLVLLPVPVLQMALDSRQRSFSLAFPVSLAVSVDYLQESQTHTQAAMRNATGSVSHQQPHHQAFQTGSVFTQASVTSTACSAG